MLSKSIEELRRDMEKARIRMHEYPGELYRVFDYNKARKLFLDAERQKRNKDAMKDPIIYY